MIVMAWMEPVLSQTDRLVHQFLVPGEIGPLGVPVLLLVVLEINLLFDLLTKPHKMVVPIVLVEPFNTNLAMLDVVLLIVTLDLGLLGISLTALRVILVTNNVTETLLPLFPVEV
jgi:hypothetical protein